MKHPKVVISVMNVQAEKIIQDSLPVPSLSIRVFFKRCDQHILEVLVVVVDSLLM
jgi:hypothetical protein